MESEKRLNFGSSLNGIYFKEKLQLLSIETKSWWCHLSYERKLADKVQSIVKLCEKIFEPKIFGHYIDSWKAITIRRFIVIFMTRLPAHTMKQFLLLPISKKNTGGYFFWINFDRNKIESCGFNLWKEAYPAHRSI